MLSYHLPQITPLLHFLILQSTHPSWTCQILFLTTFVLIHIFGEKSYKKSLTPCHTGSSSMTQFPHANYELLIIEIPTVLSLFFQRHWRSTLPILIGLRKGEAWLFVSRSHLLHMQLTNNRPFSNSLSLFDPATTLQ